MPSYCGHLNNSNGVSLQVITKSSKDHSYPNGIAYANQTLSKCAVNSASAGISLVYNCVIGR